MGFFSSIQNTLSGATFGLIPRDTSNDVGSESFQTKLNNLRDSGALGTGTNQQDKNFGNINQGFDIVNQQGNELQSGNNKATDLFKQQLIDQAQATAAQSQITPVDYGIAMRQAQDIYDQQRAQSIRDQVLLEANDRMNTASQLGNIGGSLAGQYSDAFNTNMFGQAGLETNRSQNALQSNISSTELANRQNAAYQSALGAGAQALFNSFNTPKAPATTSIPQGMGTGTAAMIDANQFNTPTQNIA